MKARIGIIILLSFSATCKASASDFKHPSPLDHISDLSVFAVAQDYSGAVWIGANNGIYRYNGNSLEIISQRPFPYHSFTSDESGRHIWAAMDDSFRRFDADKEGSTTVRAPDIDCVSSFFCAAGDSLIVCHNDKLYVSRSDSISMKLNLGKESSCITRSWRNTFLVGCEDGSLLETDLESVSVSEEPAGSAIRSIFADKNGIWVGLEGFIARYDTTFRETGRWKASSNVRTIAGSGEGTMFFGSPSGLYKIDGSGRIEREEILGSVRIPVFQLMSDWNGDIWAGTLENGCLYSNETSFPFERFPLPEGARSLHGMLKDERGHTWILTDAYGLHHETQDGWTVISGTEDRKFQFCLKDGDSAWTSDYMGDLLCLDFRSGALTNYRQTEGMKENFWAAKRIGEELYIGASGGLYVLDPKREKTVSRKIDGIDWLVHCIDVDRSGRLWMGCRNGIYSYMPGDERARKEFDSIAPLDRSYVSDIICTRDGSIAAAFLGKGVALWSEKDGLRTFSAGKGKLSDDHAVSIAEYEGKLIVGSKGGLSVIDPITGECRIYGGTNSVNFAKDCCFTDSDGSFKFAGANGIFRLPAGTEIPGRPKLNLSIDHIFANGRQVTLPSRPVTTGSVEFSHEVTGLSIDVATFDFPEVAPVTLEYILEGYSYDWIPFKPRRPIEIGNIRPGHYTLKVRDNEGSAISLGIRIRPAWYACLAAKISYVLVFILAAFLLTSLIFKRKLLAGELEREKEESKKKTIFFLDLSNSIRTPLNLLIGQIEKYFRNYGTRAPGIEDIEEAYADAGIIRNLISEFVDSQNGNAITEDEKRRAADARFLNALTAVIESNLFNYDIDTAFLCEKMNMGRTTLAARLRDTTGKTPHEFTEDIRLRHAAEMLLKGNKRVADIASDLRYCSARYFSDCFRRKFGCNPSDYKGTDK